MWFFKSVPSVTWDEIEDDGIIVDVREPYEFKVGHAPKAKNVPLSQIQNFESKKKIYLVCASGARSKRAAIYLQKKGMDAVNVKGGMMTYRG
ncbi:Rhodanese-related sulfurtransferase [Peptoniphilus asaccharolyticus DSM 20463]|uniref:Rhodanese-related sulfurtransferase n=1 Tax=Peptoniphilus asaccharolyticus DSM 20463 TaxID=573058 RepID=A0A1W1UGN1_PEPAS|nr:rhodanese-like domain-containing protein [Peptoniphilus asaccharolyticus]MBL7574691.1 rhodanese-like domain-containing protein [Peptoniphilus asaccharolyticus]SMB80199.1 Rhodanese-related sulfurtransferase [Peptoniphilus asaccharolyticus DSM 20463]